MSAAVVTVRPETSVKDVARLLAERKISGIPVVSGDDEVVGVISEADLLVKEAGRTPRRGSVLGSLLGSRRPGGRRKLEARLAGEAMTSPPITIAPYSAIATAAETMLAHGVKRLPVVRADRLVGIVSRSDLMRALARSDHEVAADVREQIESLLALAGEFADFSQLTLAVHDGEVRLSGRVRRRTVAEVLPAVVARVAGVVGVSSDLGWHEDDSKPERAFVHEQARYPL